MKQAARAILLRENKLLVMHRDKFGQEYDTLPGGAVEMNESIEQALVREIEEETGLVVQKCQLVFVEEAGPPYGTQYVFLCEDPGGDMALRADSIEAELNKVGQNTFEPRWVDMKKFPATAFRSEKLKRAVVEAVEGDFPKEPKKL